MPLHPQELQTIGSGLAHSSPTGSLTLSHAGPPRAQEASESAAIKGPNPVFSLPPQGFFIFLFHCLLNSEVCPLYFLMT